MGGGDEGCALAGGNTPSLTEPLHVTSIDVYVPLLVYLGVNLLGGIVLILGRQILRSRCLWNRRRDNCTTPSLHREY